MPVDIPGEEQKGHRVPGLRDKAMSLSGELPNRPVDAPGDVSTSMSVVAGSGPQTSIKRTEVLYAPRHHSGLGPLPAAPTPVPSLQNGSRKIRDCGIGQCLVARSLINISKDRAPATNPTLLLPSRALHRRPTPDLCTCAARSPSSPVPAQGEDWILVLSPCWRLTGRETCFGCPRHSQEGALALDPGFL